MPFLREAKSMKQLNLTLRERRKTADRRKETTAGATMEILQSNRRMIQVARIGATDPATFDDVDKTDHQVPKEDGGNHAFKIFAHAGHPAPWAFFVGIDRIFFF